MTIGKRGGPQPKYVKGRDGLMIVGLSLHKPSGRYYATHAKPRKYFGTDFDEAVARFRAWEADRNGRTLIPVRIPDPTEPAKVRLGKLPEPALPDGPFPASDVGKVRTTAYSMLDEGALYDWAGQAIRADKVKFAQRTGIAAIAWIDDIKPPEPSPSLRQIGKLYFDKRKKLSEHWGRKQQLFWNQFVDVVGNRTVRDVTADDIRRYHDAVWDEFERESRSPTFVAHRLQAVRTILRHALKQGCDAVNVRRLLDLAERFEYPKKNGVDPRPISLDDFRQLLEASSVKWKALLLLSLNAALYPSEAAAVMKKHVDLDTGTLRMLRGKTSVPRVACLWPRTVTAIREHQQAKPHQSEYLFVNMNGSPYNANHITRNFRRIRSKAGLPENVTFEQIRDAAVTAAAEAGCELTAVQALAGHRTPGITDAYLLRRPDLTRRACELIETAFFGDGRRAEKVRAGRADAIR